MELILVVVISAGMAGNSQNGVSRSLKGAGVAEATRLIGIHVACSSTSHNICVQW